MLTSPTVSGEVEEISAAAVLAWVDALGTGDDVDAWESMGPASRAHFGSKASFDEQLSGMAEGYGAWSVGQPDHRSEEHTSELQSLMRISYAVFCSTKTN